MPGYRTFRISDELAFDFARALWMADRLNRREGNFPSNPAAREKEALRRIILEWSGISVSQVASEPGFLELCQADWRCGCGSTGIGSGGLLVLAGGVFCADCSARLHQPQTEAG